MRTIRWLGAALVAALGLTAAAFVGGVSPAGAGEKAMPVRMAEAEHSITLQGQGLEALRQQVITIAGENLSERMGGLESQLGLQGQQLNAKIDQAQASLNARLDAEVAKLTTADAHMTAQLNARIDAEVAKLQEADAALHAKIDTEVAKLNAKIDAEAARLQAQMAELNARITAVSNAQNGTVTLPPS